MKSNPNDIVVQQLILLGKTSTTPQQFYMNLTTTDEELIHTLRKNLLQILKTSLWNNSYTDAEDCVGEVICSLHTILKSFDASKSRSEGVYKKLLAYCAQIGRYAFYRDSRKQQVFVRLDDVKEPTQICTTNHQIEIVDELDFIKSIV